MAMFSDRARVPKMLLTALLLGVLCWHFGEVSVTREAGYSAALRSPETWDGKPLIFPLWTVTHIRDVDVYEISKTLIGVPIRGSSEGLSIGDTVTIVGDFRASDRVVVASERVGHPLRRAKGLLSLLALILVFVFAPRFFGFHDGRVVTRG